MKESSNLNNLKALIVEFSTINFLNRSTTLIQITCTSCFEGLRFGDGLHQHSILVNLRSIGYRKTKDFFFPNDDNFVVILRKDKIKITNFTKYFSKGEKISAILSNKHYFSFVLSEF
ncbi:MAG: hypothetical protein VZS44_08715 [Bacilli bacterium]|nr:hypothetical protein [Bacilli bacterium]